MLSSTVEFSPERDAEIFAAIPAVPAVFLLRGEDAAEPYVSQSANLRRRLQRLLAAPEERSRKLNLRERARRIEYTLTGSDFESRLLLYRSLRTLFPQTYRKRLRLRPAPLVRLNLDNPWARAYVTRRIARLRGRSVYYGPFPSRAAAERFLNDSLDLFKMRRCDFDLSPDPAFPGCIYSEMKMCLAPCFKGCTDEEYTTEVGRVRAYLDSDGQSLVGELAAERESASADLAFEAAAAIHARMEKVEAARGLLPQIARPLERVTGVIVQRSAQPDAVALFRLDAGLLSGPIAFSLEQREGKPVSMEARITEALAAAPPATSTSAAEVMEHLALLKHWFYRSSRLGEVFLADERGELPLRRVVRGVSRVFRGEKAAMGDA
ncbi:MAG: excinuclease ABC subunit C [Terriglobales bacterium]